LIRTAICINWLNHCSYAASL